MERTKRRTENQKRTDGTFEVVGILDTFKGGEVVIPSTNEDIVVTGIAAYAFQGCTSLTLIMIQHIRII